MEDWKKITKEAVKGKNIRKRSSSPAMGITKSGVITLSSGLRDEILKRNPKIQFACPSYHKGKGMILIEFLEGDNQEGARKISNMKADRGTAGFAAKSFFTQVELKYKELNGKYDVERINELDGEWWFFRLK